MKFYLSPIVWENGNAFSFTTEFPVTKYQGRYQFVNERSMEHFQMNYLMDRGSSPNPPRLVHAHFLEQRCCSFANKNFSLYARRKSCNVKLLLEKWQYSPSAMHAGCTALNYEILMCVSVQRTVSHGSVSWKKETPVGSRENRYF